ncbi:MAG: helix-turn-helix transcriptional regulator [Candidatus Hodarchaeota archaeon]
MDRRRKSCTVILLSILLLVPINIPTTVYKTKSTGNTCHSTSNTGLNISTVQLIYKFYTDGEYQCNFILDALGNNHTKTEIVQCIFNISDPNIKDCILTISDTLVEVNKISYGNFSTITFSTFKLYPIGHRFSIQGRFYGKFISNHTDIYTFNLGISWGTDVAFQNTVIQINKNKFTMLSVQPTPHIIEDESLNVMKLEWNKMLVDNFEAILELYKKPLVNTFFFINMQSWEATIGQTAELTMRNNGTFDLRGWIITPEWMISNTTIFEIEPNQTVTALLTIKSSVNIGENGAIQLVIVDPLETIIIPVIIAYPAPIDLGFILLIGILAFIGIIMLIFGIIQRESIINYFKGYLGGKELLKPNVNILINPQEKSTTLLEENNWEAIETRWESVLPDQELQVLKILFFQGVVNQKTIAKQLQMSEMKMSRIINRLEIKRLLTRERSGMSKMVKLNKEII